MKNKSKKPSIEKNNNIEFTSLEQITLTPSEVLDLLVKKDMKDFRKDNILIDFGRSFFSMAEVCYSQISFGRSKKDDMKVKLPLLKSRLKVVETLLNLVAQNVNKGHSNSTIYGSVYLSILFIKSIKGRVFPSNVTEARDSIETYIDYLRHQVRIYTPKNKQTKQKLIGLSPNSAGPRQMQAINFLATHIDCTTLELTFGFNLVRKKDFKFASTQPVSEEQLSKEFNFYTYLFRELTSILLNNKSLPIEINLGGRSEWVAPRLRWMKHYPVKNENIDTAFNFRNGTFYDLDYAIGRFDLKSPISTIKRSRRQYTHINNKEHSYIRKDIAQKAVFAYFMHFLIVTGMNDSIAATLIFSEEYSEERTRHYFKGIKKRASSKEVIFEMQSEFIKDFNLFLKLRCYLLNFENVNDFKFLFFRYNRRINSKAVLPLDSQGSAGFTCRFNLKKLAPFTLSPNRPLRLTKGLWVRDRFGVSVSSYVLQHEPSVSIESYSGNDNNLTSDEFSLFFEELNKKILITDSNETLKNINIGKCASLNKPDFIFTVHENLNHCGKGEGCLFCSHYRLQSNEIDIRKIFSLQYFTEESRSTTSDQSHFAKIYEPVIKRVESLISDLLINEPMKDGLVNSVRKSVFEDEVLDPYWSQKFELYIDLGVM